MDKVIVSLLKRNQDQFAPVVPFNMDAENVVIFDFSQENKEMEQIDLFDVDSFSGYVFGKLNKAGAEFGIGRYGENRSIYKRSRHFNIPGKESRTIHLGIDIWAQENTPVSSPLDAKVHSLANNTTFGDYGPTIIMEHTLENIEFYTLYGHLSLNSVENIQPGTFVKKGEKFAEFGNYEVNGNWPPHLHFQIIKNMGDYKGDFPGVAPPSEKNAFFDLCPNPNLILQVNKLEN